MVSSQNFKVQSVILRKIRKEFLFNPISNLDLGVNKVKLV